MATFLLRKLEHNGKSRWSPMGRRVWELMVFFIPWRFKVNNSEWGLLLARCTIFPLCWLCWWRKRSFFHWFKVTVHDGFPLRLWRHYNIPLCVTQAALWFFCSLASKLRRRTKEFISWQTKFSPNLFTVFENHRKSLIQHCERSELRLHFEWTKVN